MNRTKEAVMRRVLTWVLLTLLLVSPAVGAELQGTLKKIKDTGTLTIGYRENSLPFSFVGENKKVMGYSVDLCARIAETVQRRLAMPNLQIKWVPVTVESRIQAVVNGTIDIECGSTSNTLSRQEQVDFSQMTFVDGGSLLVTVTSGIRRVSDLGGKRVAVIPGTTTEKALAAALSKSLVAAQVVTVKDHDEGRAALENGLVDAYASDRVLLIGLGLTAQSPTKLALADEYFSYEPYGFMLRRGDSAFRLVVNRALSNLYRSGDIARIYSQWLGDLGRPGSLLLAMYLLNALPE